MDSIIAPRTAGYGSRRTIELATAALALVLCPAVARAYAIQQTPLNYTEKWGKLPVPYYATAVGSDDVKSDSDVSAVAESFSDWEAVDCSKLTFEHLGTTEVMSVLATGAAPNDKNEIVWIESSTWNFGTYVLGITSPLVYIDGTIFEADIGFNGYSAGWSTNGDSDTTDVKSVAIHEIGHFFGLQHNLSYSPNAEPPTMAPVADPYGRTASLEPDDKLGACYLYPAKTSYTCKTNTECPYVLDVDKTTGDEFYSTKLICLGGICQYDTGGGTKKTLGDDCTVSADCGAPLFCDGPPSGAAGPRTCTQYCYTDFLSCPKGFVCSPFPGESKGTCIAGAPPGSPNGAPCTKSADCASTTCTLTTSGNKCAPGCSGVGAACDGGLTCFVAEGHTTGACLGATDIPVAGSPSGFPCNDASECASQICVKNPGNGGPQFCRDRCAADGTCAEGSYCATINTDNACVPGTTPVDADTSGGWEAGDDTGSGAPAGDTGGSVGGGSVGGGSPAPVGCLSSTRPVGGATSVLLVGLAAVAITRSRRRTGPKSH